MANEAQELISREEAAKKAVEKSPLYQKLDPKGQEILYQGVLAHITHLSDRTGKPGDPLANWRNLEPKWVWNKLQEEDTLERSRYEKPKHSLTRELISELTQHPLVGKVSSITVEVPVTWAIRLVSAKSQFELDRLLGNQIKTGQFHHGAQKSYNSRLPG